MSRILFVFLFLGLLFPLTSFATTGLHLMCVDEDNNLISGFEEWLDNDDPDYFAKRYRFHKDCNILEGKIVEEDY